MVLIRNENHTPILTHKTIPPKIIPTNVISQIIPEEKLRGCLITSKRTRKNATAVQSLNKLSPSSIKRSLFGNHISLAIERIATGSVAEIITPKRSITSIGSEISKSCRSRCPHRAIIAVEIRSPIVARDHIGR